MSKSQVRGRAFAPLVSVVVVALVVSVLSGTAGAGVRRSVSDGAASAASGPSASAVAAPSAEPVEGASGVTRSTGGVCGTWYQFRTAAGLNCMAPGDLSTDEAKALVAASTDAVPSPDASSTTSASSGPAPSLSTRASVTCIGNGTDGKREQLVYARRSNHSDSYATTAVAMQSWAPAIDRMFVTSAAKTGGVRKVRWVHDGSCVPTVLKVTVGTGVTTFTGLIGALQAAGLTSASRKYLVAWDDGDATEKFCGLSQTMPDSSHALTNNNEDQPLGALFSVVENTCWASAVAGHELMHSLGAVQDDAPHSTGFGHCTDESDVMCYVDGAGVVMSSVCPTDQENIFDCKDDDYFNANPQPGSYLATHWNTADSGWLDKAGSQGPPTAPLAAAIAPGSSNATAAVSWAAPASTGGTPIQAYQVTLSPGGRTITVPGPATNVVVPGLADGTPVSATIVAINRWGVSPPASTGSATPSPPVQTTVSTPDGQRYRDMARGPDGSVYLAADASIVRVDPANVVTTVVAGTAGTGVAENTLPLATPVQPAALAVAPNGDLYFYDLLTAKVRRLTGGRVNSVAGNGQAGISIDGVAALLSPLRVDALAVAGDGSVLLADAIGHVVRRVVVGSTIATVAGTAGTPGWSGDGSAATGAKLNGPTDLAVDSGGAVYVADTANNRVRKFTIGGPISTVAGDGTSTRSDAQSVGATATGVPAPSAIDWSTEKGLLVDSQGLIRALVAGNLVRVAGDPSSTTPVDLDGTPASTIDFTKVDRIEALSWSGTALRVLTAPSAVTSGAGTARLRTAAPWSSAAPASVPSAPVAAPGAVASVKSVTVSWITPSNGGSPITGYKIVASPGGAITTAGAGASNATVKSLTAGQPYTFTVQAVNAVGTGASSSPSAKVVPTAATPYAPFSTWSSLVSRVFTDLTAKPPSVTDLNAWVASLNSGAKTKGDLAASLRVGPENLANVDPVVRVYRAFLGRAPDAGGLQFWIKRKRNVAPAKTWSVLQIATEFTNSAEFIRKYGTLTNRQFVTQIYTDVLGRAADSGGVDYWTNKLDTKAKTKAQVMVGFSESNEYKTKQAQNTDVTVAYVYLMGRAPTADEITDWVTREKAGTSDAALLQELLNSAIYAAHITS